MYQMYGTITLIILTLSSQVITVDLFNVHFQENGCFIHVGLKSR
jgi:hypothetical protein